MSGVFNHSWVKYKKDRIFNNDLIEDSPYKDGWTLCELVFLLNEFLKCVVILSWNPEHTDVSYNELIHRKYFIKQIFKGYFSRKL